MKMLIVDDSMIIRRKIERELELNEITEIYTANDGMEALCIFQMHMPELVTMDLTMPAMNGEECVKEIMKINRETTILVISALADKATAIKAVKNGACGFLCKPFTEKELNAALAKLISYRNNNKVSPC
jgi:two-component system chemotaxis response regulator CheY